MGGDRGRIQPIGESELRQMICSRSVRERQMIRRRGPPEGGAQLPRARWVEIPTTKARE